MDQTAASRWLASILMLAVLGNVPDARAIELNDDQAKVFMNARSCNACHAVDEIRLGPSFRVVSLRYGDAPAAPVEWLAQKIIVGGAGSWGFVPMPGNPDVSLEQARAFARWILRLEKPVPGSPVPAS